MKLNDWKSMTDLNNVTLLIINTHNPELAITALQYSSKHIKFNCKKILTNRIPNNITDDIEYIQISEFTTREQYSKFVLEELSNYIETEFVMMIHDDGFIINPHLWLDEFLNYDYIGAPWPGSIDQHDGRVGNGGFCIRSKKLLEFCKQFGDIPDHDDWIIGVTKNEYLRNNGFKFAPITLAMKFSLELEIPECTFDLSNTFGFHGKHHQSTINMCNFLKNIEK